jgi:hypothetical protein
LAHLLGDQIPDFIGKYGGQIISLRIPGMVNGLEAKTITVQIPSQAELLDIARVLDCHFTLASVQARDRARASRKLQLKYAGPAVGISCYAEAGASSTGLASQAGRTGACAAVASCIEASTALKIDSSSGIGLPNLLSSISPR